MSTPTSILLKPTHFLFEHKAYALSDLKPEINLPELKLDAPINIKLQGEDYIIEVNLKLELNLNGSTNKAYLIKAW